MLSILFLSIFYVTHIASVLFGKRLHICFLNLFLASARMTVGEDYSPVVDSVLDALTVKNPKPIYRIGTGSVLLPTVCNYMPRWIRTYVCGCVLNFVTILPRQLRGN